MPDDPRDAIIDKLTAAGATDEEIVSILKEKFGQPQFEPGGPDSIVGNRLRGVYSVSDTPEREPDTWWGGFTKGLNQEFGTGLRDRLIGAMQPIAHPQTKEDIAPLLLPTSIGTGAAVSAGARAARGPVGRGVSATGRGVEAVGTALQPASIPLAVTEAAMKGSLPEAVAIAAGPTALRATGRGLQRAGRAIEGRPRILDEPMPFPSTMPGGPQSGTRPAPPYRPRPDVPDSPAATGTAEWYPERPTPEPILNPPDSPNARGAAEWYPERPAPEPTVTPDSPNASGRSEWYQERNVAPEPGPTGTAEWYPERPTPPPGPVPSDAPILRKPPKTPDQILDEMLQEGLTPETPMKVEGPPSAQPTTTTGRPAVTAAEQAAIEARAARRGAPRIEEMTPDAEMDLGTTSGFEPTTMSEEAVAARQARAGGGESAPPQAAAPAGESSSIGQQLRESLVERAQRERQQDTVNKILDYHGRNNMPGVSRKQAAQVDTRPYPHALSGEAQARIATKVSEGLASAEARQSLIEYYNNARNDLFKNQLGTAMRKAGILPSE